MTARMPHDFAPRTIANARTERSIYLGRLIRIGLRRVKKRIAAWHARIAQARQYRRDMALLLQADHRMLADIGITRADVRAAAAESSWRDGSRMLAAATEGRNAAMARTRRPSLPRVDAPALAPRSLGRVVETANFR